MRFAALLPLLFLAASGRADLYSDVAKILGPGSRADDGYIQNVLRSDLQIENHAGMLISPEMGLECRTIVTQDGAAGEFCLIREELDAVTDKLRAVGIEITQLSNRIAGESPGLYFLAFEGKGKPLVLAKALKATLDDLGKQRSVSEGLQRTGNYPSVNWRAVEAILGASVKQIGSSRVWMAEAGQNEARFGGCPCGRTQLVMRMQISEADVQKAIDAARKGKLTLTCLIRGKTGYSATFEGEGEATVLAGSVRQVWQPLKG